MLRLWCKLHEKLVKSAATWRPPAGGGLALLGDSITESWRGTEFGRRVPRAHGVPRVLRETLGTRWPEPLVLGIAGDQTQHLLWRIENGELKGCWSARGRGSNSANSDTHMCDCANHAVA